METEEAVSEHLETLFYSECNQAQKQATQRGLGVSIPAGVQNPPGHGPEQLTLGGPAWAGGWTKQPP